MNKICCLIPCLMLSNNREVNKKAMDTNYNDLNLDKYIVCDQCFSQQDFDERFEYIAHSDKPLGWAIARNKLLEWFYNSDYDYAFWIDANSTISKSCYNDVLSIFEYLRNNNSDIDAIFSTLGIIVSNERISCKKMSDHLEVVRLTPAKLDKTSLWMHGLIIKNFKKYNDEQLYIDERCDSRNHIPEDIYFSRLLRNLTNTYHAPTVIVNKPSAKTSTWMHDKGSYEYPYTDYETVDMYVNENIKDKKFNLKKNATNSTIEIKRIDKYKDLVKPYTPRVRKKQTNIVSLF